MIERGLSFALAMLSKKSKKGVSSAPCFSALVRARALELLPNSGGHLDLACGEGLLVERILRTTDLSVDGVDGSPEMLARSQRRVGRTRRFRAILADVRLLPYSDESFSSVTLLDLLSTLRIREGMELCVSTMEVRCGYNVVLSSCLEFTWRSGSRNRSSL